MTIENTGEEELQEVDDDQLAEELTAEPPDQQTFSEQDGVEAEPVQQGDEEKSNKAFARMRKENADLRRDIEAMRNMMMNFQSQQPEEPQEERFDPEDILTRGQYEELREKDRKELSKESKQLIESFQKKEAYRNHPDYDDVIELARARIAETPNPQLTIKKILEEEDPYEAAYIFGSLHPEYQKKEKTKTQKETVETIKKNLSQPSTLSSMRGSAISNLDKADYYANMSDEEFDKLEEKVLGGGGLA